MKLVRRTFLRAAGVTLSLPLLDYFFCRERVPAKKQPRCRAAWFASARRWGCTQTISSPRQPAKITRCHPIWNCSKTIATSLRSSRACLMRG